MKKYTKVFLVLGGLCLFSLLACGGTEKKTEAPADMANEKYQCPMKCTEEIFDKAGNCSLCGMELEKITKS